VFTRISSLIKKHDLLYFILLLPFLVYSLFPFWWMLMTSIKKNSELYDLSSNPFWVRDGVTIEHYSYLLKDTLFPVWMKNSLIVGVVTTAISVAVSILAAYALARLQFRGASFLALGIFAVYLIPRTLLFIPLAQVIGLLGISDSLFALIFTYPSFMVPFSTWMLLSYFKGIPKEIEECAMIDGCSRLQAVFKVVLPMAIPGVITSTLFCFLNAWQEFIYAVTFISTSSKKTAPVGVVGELVRGDVYYWGSLMAAALLASIPVVIVFSFLMDYYVSGLTAGAVKQ